MSNETIYFAATTSDGTVLTRSTSTMNYSHCVASRRKDGMWRSNWCSRRDLADAQAQSTRKYAELVEVIEATRIPKPKKTPTAAEKTATKLANKLRAHGFVTGRKTDRVWVCLPSSFNNPTATPDLRVALLAKLDATGLPYVPPTGADWYSINMKVAS